MGCNASKNKEVALEAWLNNDQKQQEKWQQQGPPSASAVTAKRRKKRMVKVNVNVYLCAWGETIQISVDPNVPFAKLKREMMTKIEAHPLFSTKQISGYDPSLAWLRRLTSQEIAQMPPKECYGVWIIPPETDHFIYRRFNQEKWKDTVGYLKQDDPTFCFLIIRDGYTKLPVINIHGEKLTVGIDMSCTYGTLIRALCPPYAYPFLVEYVCIPYYKKAEGENSNYVEGEEDIKLLEGENSKRKILDAPLTARNGKCWYGPVRGGNGAAYGMYFLRLQPFALSIQTLTGKKVNVVAFGSKTTLKQLVDKLKSYLSLGNLGNGRWGFEVDGFEVDGLEVDVQSCRIIFQGKEYNLRSCANMLVMDCGVQIPTGSTFYIINGESTTTSNPRKTAGSNIPQTELRAITIRQLRDVAAQILVRCEKEKWVSTNEATKGKDLKPEEVTLYDLVHNFILPVTREKRCSYVEHVAEKPQRPDFYVSHWWGEPVLQFVAALEQHALDRYAGQFVCSKPPCLDDVAYWVCGYANNQHDLKNEIPQDIENTSFFRAMQLAKGVVSIMDQKAICFTRIWCSFEIFVAFRNLIADTKKSESTPYVHDIYTANAVINSQHECRSLTDGCVGLMDGLAGRKNTIPKKRRLQQSFPITPEVLNIRMENAEASREEDKTNILNYISETINNHDKNTGPYNYINARLRGKLAYNNTNATLRGKFALAVYRNEVERCIPSLELEKYRLAISQHPHLSHLKMDFTSCKGFREEARNFITEALPPCLVSLDLNLSSTDFEGTKEFSEGLSRLSKLNRLVLVAAGCERLKLIQVNDLFNEIKQLPELTYLSLCFAGCHGADFDVTNKFSPEPSKLSKLKTLHIDARNCQCLKSIEYLFDEIKQLPDLTDLILRFGRCPKIESMPALGTPELGILRFGICPKIESMPALGTPELGELKHLTVEVGLAWFHTLCQFESFFKSLGALPELEVLQLRLNSECFRGSRKWMSGRLEFGEIPSLQRLVLDIGRDYPDNATYYGFLDSSQVCRNLFSNAWSLRSFTLKCRNDGKLSTMDGLLQDVDDLYSLREVELDFSGCRNLTSIAMPFSKRCNLEKISLLLEDCHSVNHFNQLFPSPIKLKEFDCSLDISNAPFMTFMKSSFSNLLALQKLRIHWRPWGPGIEPLSFLCFSDGFATQSNLTELDLSLECDLSEENLTDLCLGLGHLSGVRRLTLRLTPSQGIFCNKLGNSTVVAIGNSICGGMKKIRYLNVQLSWFTKISSLKGLAQAVERLRYLEEFSVHVTSVIDVDSTIAEFCRVVARGEDSLNCKLDISGVSSRCAHFRFEGTVVELRSTLKVLA